MPLGRNFVEIVLRFFSSPLPLSLIHILSFLDKDVVIKKEKMFVEIHFHLLILEEKEQSCFCQMEWVLEKKRMRIAGD